MSKWNWPCFLGQHKWKYTRVAHYRDCSYSVVGAESYSETHVCLNCGKAVSENHFNGGYPTLDQLNGV